MADRGYTRRPSDPGVIHKLLVAPGIAWPSNGVIPLTLKTGGAVEPRIAYLVFETAGTVLLEDEEGTILPYTRAAGAILPVSFVAIRQTVSAPAYSGAATATTSTLVLYGHGG